MATTTIELDSKHQFSDPTTEAILGDLNRVNRLSGLLLEGAEVMTRLSLEAFTLARKGEPRAQKTGCDFLDCAEGFFGTARTLLADAEALAARHRT